MQPGPLFPSSLPPGTLVGPWRILDWRGSGGHGTVYLAEGVAPQAPAKVVVKLALHPWDARFGREVTLLSRLRHPCIPRFLDQGQWQSAEGLPYAYVVMEWIHGLPLYVWARAVYPSSRKVIQVLADVARALEAIHAADALHRDVKGDNMLVRREDGRGFLTDFGSSTWQGADPLTEGIFPPATRNYRSPEAYRFAANVLKSPIKQYSPGRADDLFALGVTGYRLVTGQYPPLPQDPQDPESHVWDDFDGPGPRTARELNPCCAPELSALISRMLSARPEARGSARVLAEALEQAASSAGLGADAPLFLQPDPRPREGQEVRSAPDIRGGPRRGYSRRAAASLSVALSLAAFGLLTWEEWRASRSERTTEDEEEADEETVGLGDELLAAPVAPEYAPPGWSTIGLDLPSKPLPGQVRPNASGRCPSKNHFAINGGCWRDTKEESPGKCDDFSYRHNGACYVPVYHLPRPPTSSPTDVPDGGAR